MATNVSSVSLSDSSLTRVPSMVEYPESPRVRNRHQVKWSDVIPRNLSSPKFEEPNLIQASCGSGSEGSLHIEELDSSPSISRRQRKKRRRNRKKQQEEYDEEELQLPVLGTTSADTHETISVDDAKLLPVPDEHSQRVGPPQTFTSGSHLRAVEPSAAVSTDVSNFSRSSQAAATEQGAFTFKLINQKAPAPEKSMMSNLPFSDISIWMALSLALLMLSNIFFFVAFVTHSWGTISNIARVDIDGNVTGATDALWNFGLWRCCRNDGLCLGARWPAFYSATRVFAVLALFGHALSFALIFGHTVERLLDYDPCTMLSMIASCFLTAAFVVITVSVYGVVWPLRFSEMLLSVSFDSTTQLGYSYYLALICAPLMSISGLLALIDLNTSRRASRVRQTFAEVYDEGDDVDDDGIVVDKNYQTFTASSLGGATNASLAVTEPLRNLPYLDRSSLFQEESLM